MKKILLVLLLITGSLFAQTFEQRYGLLQPPSIFKRLGTTVSTVGATDNVSLYTLALGGATIGANQLAITGSVSFSGVSIFTATGINTTLKVVGDDAQQQLEITSPNGVVGFKSGVGANTNYIRSLNGAQGAYQALVFEASSYNFAQNSPATFTGTLLAPNGSAASPSYSFTSDPNSGMYSIGADQVGLSVNGSNMVTVTTTGVGIGMTAPTANLHLGGSGTVFKGGFTSALFKIRNTGYDEATIGTGFIEHDAYGDLLLGATRSLNDLGAVRLYAGNSERVTILGGGNVGIATINPLATFHDNGTAMFGAGTGASLTDSSLVINYTTGSPVLNWYGTDGDTWNLGINTSDHAVFSGATLYSFDNGITLADAGTSANSYAITLTADNATTPQLAQLYNAYGASPYIVVAPSNGAGTPTPAIYIHSDAMNFIDSYSLTTNTADDDNVIFKAVDNDDNVLYEVARLTGAATPTFDLLAGRLTGALNANSQDISSVNALGAVSLTLTGAFTGSSLTDGNDAFTTTATADTVTISGASVNDRYYGNYTTAVTAAESPLSIVATATGFIATRPIGTTSDAAYNWFRIKH